MLMACRPRWTVMPTLLAPGACRATFVSASWTTRYTVEFTSAGQAWPSGSCSRTLVPRRVNRSASSAS
jgi:hypothetical protein